jgi:hypothetical protein
MPRKNSNGVGSRRNGTASKYGDDFKGFADIPLSEDHRNEIEPLLAGDLGFLLEFIEQTTEAGYKLSVVYNPGVRSHIATLTGRAGTGENEGYALSGFGPGAVGALAALYMKHAVVAHWGPWVGDSAVETVQPPLFR